MILVSGIFKKFNALSKHWKTEKQVAEGVVKLLQTAPGKGDYPTLREYVKSKDKVAFIKTGVHGSVSDGSGHITIALFSLTGPGSQPHTSKDSHATVNIRLKDLKKMSTELKKFSRYEIYKGTKTMGVVLNAFKGKIKAFTVKETKVSPAGQYKYDYTNKKFVSA